jgi:hypothetical protein
MRKFVLMMWLLSFDSLAMEPDPTQEDSGLTKKEVIEFLLSLEKQPKDRIGVFYENSELSSLGVTFAITGGVCAFLLVIPGLMPGAVFSGVICSEDIAEKECIDFLTTTLVPVGINIVHSAILPFVAPLYNCYVSYANANICKLCQNLAEQDQPPLINFNEWPALWPYLDYSTSALVHKLNLPQALSFARSNSAKAGELIESFSKDLGTYVILLH